MRERGRNSFDARGAHDLRRVWLPGVMMMCVRSAHANIRTHTRLGWNNVRVRGMNISSLSAEFCGAKITHFMEIHLLKFNEGNPAKVSRSDPKT